MSPQVEHWRVPAGAVYEWRHFGDESALFDPRSGLTHFLSAIAVEALAILRDEVLALDALTARLMECCEIDDAAAFSLQVERMLVQLGNLDLVEPDPNHAAR